MAEPPDSGRADSVLLITRNLPPLLGGMEKLNLHLVHELALEMGVIVVGPEGCGAHLPSGVPASEVPHKPLWKFLPIALLRSADLARRFRPDCVMAGSGLTAPIAYIAARLCGARAIVYVHGLDLVAPHRLYQWCWLPFLRRMELCIANSRNTAELAASQGIPRKKITVVHPGVDLPRGEDPHAAEEFRRQHGLESKKILLSVGRMTPRKGLVEFVDRALPSITRACPEAVLVVIGNEAPDALSGNGAGTAERIARLAAGKGLEHNVRLLGPCIDSVLAAAWQAADLHVFPLRQVPGDVEGFGMVAVEAASYGLPTVAFSVGGVEDAVADNRSGWLLAAGDYAGISRRVVEALDRGRSEAVRQRCREFAEAFALPRFGAELRRRVCLQELPASQH